MFSIKVLPALAYALMAASVAAYGQPKAATTHTQAVHAHMPSADIDLGGDQPASGGFAHAGPDPQPPVAVAASAVAPSAPAEPRLSIEDVDRIARSSIARQLAGNGSALPAGVALNGAAPAAAPVNAPVSPVNSKPAPVRSRSEPVRFVGAFSDVSGQGVLYEYRAAAYPAHVGAKLLNGWTVKRVDGFVVTVAEGTGKGARTWTETISGGTPARDTQQSPVGGLAFRGLPDLSGPLPPSMPLSAVGR
ncbi:hypothetical protein B0G69_8087 [Paraburkholderia sp. RAU2J]|uniref:hypothetical protein n=1 Tax=Paraburkholderia sp. RAU2J TaxID=1938810 RepID=UPI000EAD0B90|nr:hypothetical protein [Paraburkholderia sp. RAU2J]RKT10653.1 hypothetical protein B0G69_8087 [Paraburkholderia sp. RAU2J]